jgi:Fe-S oxidoreductase
MYKSETNNVVYFPGCFVNYWDFDTGKAIVYCLESNNIQVVIPEHQCCGIPQIGYGDYDAGCKSASRLVNTLYPYVDHGYDIITSCPSCCLAIKEEYPLWLCNEQANLVSKKTFFWSQYLLAKSDLGEDYPSFNKIRQSIAYHAPCHLKVQRLEQDTLKLMSLIFEQQVIDLNRGCCGMAGTFGLKNTNYDKSMLIGRILFDRIDQLKIQIVTTDCGACKMRLEQATNKQVLHPAILLQKALAA